MSLFPSKNAAKEKPKPDPFYYEVELTPQQRQAVLDLIRLRIQRAPSAALSAFLKRLETEVLTARRINTPLIRERLDWGLARSRGCSEVELFEDLAHCQEPE